MTINKLSKKSRKTLIQLWSFLLMFPAMSLVLFILRWMTWHSIPILACLLPVLLPAVLLLSVTSVLLVASWRYNALHKRKCCGNCVHCYDDVYAKKESICLRGGHKITPRPGRHSCKHFFGSVMKGYIGAVVSEKSEEAE